MSGPRRLPHGLLVRSFVTALLLGEVGCSHAPRPLSRQAIEAIAEAAPLADSCRFAAGRRDYAASLRAASLRFERVGAVLPPDHPALLGPLLEIGAAHRRCGNLGLAEHYLRTAANLARRARGSEPSERAGVLHELGLVCKDTGRPEEARRMFDAALHAAGGGSRARDSLAAAICESIGNWEIRFGSADRAIAWSRRSLALSRNCGPLVRADALTWLGFALLRSGRHDEAARYLREALGLLDRSGADQPSARSTLDLLAMTIGPEGSLDEVENLLDRSTRLADQEAGRQPPGFGLSRAHPSILRGLAEVHLLRGRTEQAWETTQVWAGWVTDALMMKPRESDSASEPDTAMTALVELDALLDRPEAPGTAPDAQRLSWLVEAAALEARWLQGRRVDHVRSPRHPPVLAELQATLGPDEALIGWLDAHWDDDARHGGRHTAWGYVVRHDGAVHWVRLAQRNREQDYLEWCAPLRDYARDLQSAASWPLRAPPDPLLDSLAAQVGARIFWPLLPHLDGVRRLVAVYEVLGRMVPLESLRLPDGRTLADRYPIVYTPSARTFVTLRARARTSRRPERPTALVIGDPEFRRNGGGAKATVADTAVDWNDVHLSVLDPTLLRSVLSGRSDPSQLPRLPQARREARAVAAAFDRATLLVGAAASAPEIDALRRSGRLARFDVVHLATHALVDEVYPERSAIALAPGDGGGASGGLVRAGEMFDDWRLDAGLVTLSSCQTADGGFTWGAQPLGLAQTLLRAGAGGLLLSLWKVDDLATGLLMQRFYALMEGKSPDGTRRPLPAAEALRRARLSVRDFATPEGLHPFAHPAYWAGFVLIGDPGPRVTGNATDGRPSRRRDHASLENQSQ